MKKKTIALILNLLLLTVCSRAQVVSPPNPPVPPAPPTYSADTHVTSDRTIKFTNESGTKEIKVDVKKGTERFEVNIRSSVLGGTLDIEVFDPSGVKHGSYSIGTQLNSGAKESVMGSISKSLKQPKVGTWIIKIVPSSATGRVYIKTSFFE